MLFQASDTKESNFLDLLDDNLWLIEPFYSKEGLCYKLKFLVLDK